MNNTEDKYKTALKIWLNNNPQKNINLIRDDEKVNIPDGQIVRLGAFIKKLRSKNCFSSLDDQTKEYWFKEKGLITCTYNKYVMDMEYRESFKIWQKNNQGKNINEIPKDLTVQYNNCNIPLGLYIFQMKQILRNKSKLIMLDFQRDYWVLENGLSPYEVHIISESEYQTAYENWLLENKGKTINDIKQKTKVVIEKNKDYKKEIKLGIRIMTMRAKPTFTKEQYNYWIKGAKLRVNHEIKIVEKKAKIDNIISEEDLFVDKFINLINLEKEKKLIKKL